MWRRARSVASRGTATDVRASLLACALCVAAVAPRIAAAAPADEEDTPSGRFEPIAPLTLAELYTKRIRFSRQEPWLSVGLMDGQREVTLGATGPLRVIVDDGDMPRTLYAPERARFTFRVEDARPARVQHWVVVATGPADARARLEAEAAPWRAKGLTVRVFEAGTVMATQGRVLDTRQLQLALGPPPGAGTSTRSDTPRGGFASLEAAEAQLRALAREGRRETFLREELVEPPSGVITVHDATGREVARARDVAYVGTTTGERLWAGAVEFGRGYKFHGREDRELWGHLYVVVDRGGRLALVNSVRAERFLRGLVPAEIFADAPLEALKAQAVTARGEIFSKLAHRHFGEPFHLCAEQHCQVYKGAREERPGPNRAVRATRGEIAARPRRAGDEGLELVDSVYSSSCGGASEANEIVWGTPPSPSLRPRLDGIAADPALAAFTLPLDEAEVRAFVAVVPPTDCARATMAAKNKLRWTRTFTQAELDAIGGELGLGRLVHVEVLGRGPGGRVIGVRVSGTSGSLEILQELPVRRAFRNLLSGLFVLDAKKNARGELAELTFRGGGWGHGVGMCQMGAIGRAERGQSYRQILEHYYGGAVVEALY